MEGGGYCTDENDCVKRSYTDLGSSKKWPNTITIDGFLSDDCTQNPHFCGWSVIFIPYCDGGVFSGNMLVIIFGTFQAVNLFLYISTEYIQYGLDFAKSTSEGLEFSIQLLVLFLQQG